MIPGRLVFHDLNPRSDNLREDVIQGLALPQKSLPPKYFYDARGSELFERICDLPEYYPTRTEMRIMVDSAAEMASYIGRGASLIEFGSGSGVKTRVLLQALQPLAYLPIDISITQLKASAGAFAGEFPGIAVAAIHADYTAQLDIAALLPPGASRRAVYFSGSTIGNFTPEEARVFLRRASALVGRGGALLIGVDLRKDPAVLHAAYNDAAGVTAAFNLNLLERINRELQADFNLSAWSHHAFYNVDDGRIEMHLVSRARQQVTIAGQRFLFADGETIHTENSYKYSIAGFQSLAQSAGFAVGRCWTDASSYFSVHYLVAD